MDLDAFMTIDTAVNNTLAGESTDAPASSPHTGEIEILSFEHTIHRTPTRDLVSHYDAIQQRYQQESNVDHDDEADPNWLDYFQQAAEQVAALRRTQSLTALAQRLVAGRLVVYKCLDVTTPVLANWAGQRNFLNKVKVAVRAPVTNGTPLAAVQKDLFAIYLTFPWIIDYEMVGDFQVQPWRELAIHPHVAASLMGFGPVERIEFAYQGIGWWYGDQGGGKAGWDFTSKNESWPG